MKKSIIISISGILLISCDQISKSIKDTLKSAPVDSTAYVEREEEAPKSPFDPAVERQIDQAQRLVNTIMEKNHPTHVQHPKEGKNTNFLTNEQKLNKAEEALKKLPQYMGKEIFVYSTISFYDDGRIHLMLQHPKNPEYVDNYDYKDGNWSEPTPEQLSVKDDIKTRLVSLNKIPFSNIARAATIYKEKSSKIEGAEPITNIYISVWKNTLRWYPSSISGSRERYSIELNENGTLKKFENK
ncbi:hypothetical protein CEY12_02600 [Chryseobacterium sp. T16E-39]|uniref:hypothetical protein n=1 Tax=Chryseobacterium sp. T16E-39 TaxID=2015076 RepID=UPI000B5B13F7|nr:hypothetical protein [Chryseobacterium sp. T16E-39]ASK29060.1 hypothetical protein CEY12_02600 [Chryseobacterium sp. T16E-39]